MLEPWALNFFWVSHKGPKPHHQQFALIQWPVAGLETEEPGLEQSTLIWGVSVPKADLPSVSHLFSLILEKTQLQDTGSSVPNE